MPLIRKRLLAELDVRDIWRFIAEDSEAQADFLLASFDEKLRLLCERPQMGRSRDDLAKGLRCFPVGKYILFYLIVGKDIDLIRVLHSARDLTPAFFSDDTP